ncbi:dimethylarginine dimethylaminohydrolase family protein [Jannaschia sp. LMIT008]|uniref:dimethylarginine dimethylaminohydrolase family protein n=1 Tax=Jannaschia maritima TaxID=3032585 RepID=UPI00281190AB|nr:arginine deiminase family protein [Jannaschia sp. LMIT008]
MSHATHFTRAIVRRPADSAVDGLRAEDIGTPDLGAMRADHAAYVAALEETGASVTVLPPLPAYPDAQFVEDTALCLPQGAVLMRPSAPSRAGEVATIEPVLRDHYETVVPLTRGRIEGGDVLVSAREVLVGLSARTDTVGVAALRAVTEGWGHSVREVRTPAGVLHLKTDCGLLADDTVLATERLAASGCFDGYRVLRVPAGEEAAANCIRFNDVVIMPAGFPRTAEMLDREGFAIVPIGNAECAKLDGGMSCLSLRF